MNVALVGLLTLGLWTAFQQQTPPAREAYAEIGGARIWFKDTGGTGVPVVFLHAATGSVRSWEKQYPVFTAAGYRVIAFDRRGWGRTTVQTGTPSGTAADDLQNLLTYLGVDRFHLVGTAAGGFVALDYALSFPEKLRSLIVANSIGGLEDADYLEMGRRLRPPEFDALPPHLRELGPSYRAADPEGTRAWLELERMSRRPDAPAAQPFRNHMTFALLERIKTPTLIMTGDADMYAPPPLLRMFTDRIKGSQSIIVPEAGHSSYWEKPEIFNRGVLEFIRQH
jgi:pimeloyl-ACP methyl ester carboxylesterase